MHPEIAAIFFDLDGTIVDTEPAAARAVRESFAQWGIRVTKEDATYVTGRTWKMAFEHLFGKYELPLPSAKAGETIMHAYEEALKTGFAEVPGAVAAVQALSNAYPLALVSGSRRVEILWVLGKLGITDRFRLILGAEDYPRSKPDPVCYVRAMEKLAVKAGQTLIFEDSTAGIAAGRASGAWVVAITGTNHHGQNTSGAHAHIPDFSGVTPDWIQHTASSLS